MPSLFLFRQTYLKLIAQQGSNASKTLERFRVVEDFDLTAVPHHLANRHLNRVRDFIELLTAEWAGRKLLGSQVAAALAAITGSTEALSDEQSLDTPIMDCA